MNKIAKFEKVSFKQFREAWNDCIYENSIVELAPIYENIQLPKRATMGSAGYDFYSPVNFTLKPNSTITIPTGIRSKIEDGWVLCLYPRSGLGFKYRLQLNNTVGIVDSDYYNADNEGHIFIKITNDSNENKTLYIKSGDRFVQGIFTQYGITVDDETDNTRNGGMCSTGGVAQFNEGENNE